LDTPAGIIIQDRRKEYLFSPGGRSGDRGFVRLTSPASHSIIIGMGDEGRVQVCPACRADNSSDSRFCRECGAPLRRASETLPYPEASAEAPAASVPPASPRFAPGSAFGRRYRIIEEVGRGGMGRVYKAEDKELRTTVALKMIRPELATDPNVLDLFKKEILLARSISHDNVVRIHDLGEVGRTKYVSMEFIKGEDLKSLISLSGALSVDKALKIAIQVGEALRAAHRKNIVHQDLKPQNIMVDPNGRVSVTDFGLATLKSVEGTSGPAGGVGTPLYISPEQARGAPADPRSDIYSFGVVLFEMLTGREPFQGGSAPELARQHLVEPVPPPSHFNPALPAALERIVLKCLAKRREDRYQSIDALLAELKKLEPGARYAPSRRRGGRLLWGLPAFLAVLILVVVGVRKFVPKPEASATATVRSPLRRISVAVLDAVNLTGDASLDYWRAMIEDMLSTDLAQSRYLAVLPDDRVNKIIKDMGRPGAGPQATDVLDRIADEEGVEYFILPSFARSQDRFRLSVKVRKSGANEGLDSAASVDGQDLFTMVDALTQRLKMALRLSQSEIASDTDRELAQISTTSLDALRYYMDGKRLYLEYRFNESNDAFSRAVAIDPNFALAYKKMAENYNYLGDIPRAREMIGRALALLDHVPDRERYLIQGFAATLLDESPQKAIDSYQRLLELYPNDEEGHILLASVYRNLERWDEAKTGFEFLLDLNPRSELAVENLAFIDSALGRYEEAKDLVRAQRARFPNSLLLACRMARLDQVTGQFDQARQELDLVLRADSQDERYLELEGNLFQLKDDLAAARASYEKLRNSQNPSGRYKGRFWTAGLRLFQGRFEEAKAEAAAGVADSRKAERLPDAIDFLLILARIGISQGRWDEAAADAREAYRIADQILYLLLKKEALQSEGLALTAAGRLDEAERTAQELRNLIDRTGCTAHAKYYEALKAAIALKRGNAAGAVEWQEKAVAHLSGQIDSYDDQAVFLDGLGRAYEATGQPEKAAAAYERLTALTTGRLRWGDLNALAYDRLGRLSEAAGLKDRAVSTYEKFLSFWGNADGSRPEPDAARARLKILKGTASPKMRAGPPASFERSGRPSAG
jgi:tetratricopeptide (TPR) repeat protein